MPVGRCSFLGLLIAVPMVGCAALYPRFDNPLNPDIAFPNVGDVVDGVKCAVSSYLFERAARIQAEQRTLIETELPKMKARELGYCIGMDDYIHPTKWRIALLAPKKDDPNDCEFHRVLEPAEEKKLLNPTRPTVEEEKLRAKNEEVLQGGGPLTQSEINRLYQLVRARRVIWPGIGECFPAYKEYQYIKLSKSRGAPGKYTCEPNGGCLAGTTPQRNGTCAADETSRFALDPNSNAKIEMTISAINTGSMNYQRIDATRLDFLPSIIVPGDSAKGFPFPTFKATDKKTNRVAVSVLMPQAILKQAKKSEKIDEILNALKISVDEGGLPEINTGSRKFFHHLRDRDRSYERPDALDVLSRQVLDELTKTHDEYETKCKGYPLKVDFLALQRYIARIVTEQEQRVFGGAPQISLDSLVLTSEFQLQFDATMGTQNLLRILPVFQPPVLGLSPDHTHNLKITFAGAKARGLASGGTSLIQKCIARFRNTPAEKTADGYCREAEAIHRESIIDAVESSGKGG